VTIDWAVWGPPAAVLCAAVAFGVLSVVRLRSEDRSVTTEGRTIDLASTRDAAVQALRQLELERPKMDPADYERERELLIGRGARALEALDSPSEAAPAPAPAAAPRPTAAEPGARGLSPEWKGALAMLAVVLVAGGIWQLLDRTAEPRREGANMTGNQELGGASAPPDPKQSPEYLARKAELDAKIATNPSDVESLNQLTFLYLRVGDPPSAMQTNDKALAVAPNDADARTWRAVITAMMGMTDKAMEGFDAVLRDVPDHPQATVYKGLLLLEEGKPTEAIPFLERAIALNPGNPAAHSALEQARRMAAGGGMPPMAGAAPAGGAPPAGAIQTIVQGTIAIDPAAASAVPAGGVLFWSVRDPARPGPPVAADRADLGSVQFPMTFALTTEHIRAMPGASTTLPASVDLTVRVDSDGNAMTREAGLPSATIPGVAIGTSNVTVLLRLDPP
jgi:tetratricopeptide (TPR) repeat protein